MINLVKSSKSLDEILTKNNEKEKKNHKVKVNFYAKIKAFDILSKTYVELKLTVLEYLILRSSRYIILENYPKTDEKIKLYLIKCTEKKYIISPSNKKEEIDKYCKSLY